MNIVCCTDHNYVMPTGVMMCSVCENNHDCEVFFHVICNDDVTEEDKRDLTDIAHQYNNRICFHSVNIEVPSCFTIKKENQPKHITISAYYRLFLTEILPNDIEKVLYLDSDIIVRHSLHEMYNTDIKDYAAGVVTDMGDGNLAFYNYLRYSPKYGYFNSGVILINLSYWKEHNILQDYIDFATQYPERIILHDQDIMNYVLKDKKKQIPLTYNFQHGFLFKKLGISWEYEDELNEAIKNPYILHFTGKKPWVHGCDHPYREEYTKYKKMTIWKDTPLRKAPKTTWKTKIKNSLIGLGVMRDDKPQYISVPSLK
ncbi:MAG: glycosyltransferase family 8 protein [Bacteroidaceae bacterium]|nr:glycosyltransferase family 8 protein [Bacteroidaceae bacterium]